MWNSWSENMLSSRRAENGGSKDEEDLVLAALQRSPTYIRARTSILRGIGGEVSLVDVGKMKGEEQKEVLDVLMNAINEDTELFFKRVKERFGKGDYIKEGIAVSRHKPMLIASKYEEIWASEVNDFVCILDRAHTHEQVLAMEKRILRQLEWYLCS